MTLNVSQIWSNLFYFIVLALLLELAISSIFSIPFLQELLQSSFTKSVKNMLVLLAAVGLCVNIPKLRILARSGLTINDVVHIALSALILSRLSSLFHTWFLYLKKKSQEIN